MSRRIVLATVILSAATLGASRAHAQFFPGVNGGFSSPPFLPTTAAPHSAPGSIFPGPGPNSFPPAVFFGRGPGFFKPFRPVGFNGGFAPYFYGGYPYYYDSYAYETRQIYPPPAEPEVPIYTATRSADRPLQGFPALESPSPTRARLTLTVPADAEVWLAGKKLEGAGTTRTLESPDLKNGESYTFELRIRWMEGSEPVEETRKTTVGIGQSKSLTFLA